MIDLAQKRKWDAYAVRKTQERIKREACEARREAREARKKALAEGRAEGRVEERAEMARAMKVKGFSFQDIAEISSLSIEEIQKL